MMKITKKLFSLLLALLLVAPAFTMRSYGASVGNVEPKMESKDSIFALPTIHEDAPLSVADGAGDHCITFYSLTEFSISHENTNNSSANSELGINQKLYVRAGNPKGTQEWTEVDVNDVAGPYGRPACRGVRHRTRRTRTQRPRSPH